MKINGPALITIGVIALIGALIGAYLNLLFGEAIGLVASSDGNELPPGTDLAALQESAQALGTLVTVGWIWIISVILASLAVIYYGILTIRGKLAIK